MSFTLIILLNICLSLVEYALVFYLATIFSPESSALSKLDIILPDAVRHSSSNAVLLIVGLLAVTRFILGAYINRRTIALVASIKFGIQSSILSRIFAVRILLGGRRDFESFADILINLPSVVANHVVLPALRIATDSVILLTMLCALILTSTIETIVPLLVMVMIFYWVRLKSKQKYAVLSDSLRISTSKLYKDIGDVELLEPILKSGKITGWKILTSRIKTSFNEQRILAISQYVTALSPKLVSELLLVLTIALMLYLFDLGVVMLPVLAIIRMSPLVTALTSNYASLSLHQSPLTRLMYVLDEMSGESSSKSPQEYSFKARLMASPDFRIGVGSICFITGRSGEGKSTLVKYLVGQTPNYSVTDDSRILLSKLEDYFQSELDHIDYYPQHKAAGGLTVRDFIAETSGVDAAGPDLLRSYFDQLDLRDSLMEARMGDLSGGEYQRVCIARSFLRSSRCLIFDEPFSGLDSISKTKGMELLRQLSQERVVFIVSHDLVSFESGDQVIAVVRA